MLISNNQNDKKQAGKVSQSLLIVIVLAITAIIATFVIIVNKSNTSGQDATDRHVDDESQNNDASTAHDDEEIVLSAQQMTEQGLKLAKVDMGIVETISQFPAKLVANTDRQAHVSPILSGRVESVQVELGQYVKKGQALATLFVPDLVDQQSNLKIEEANLELARQDFEREKQLWTQGISAKQDYQRASNTYKQAQIQVQAARSRISAFGASVSSNGRYVLTAPISGVISSKDLVIGENVQLADQLFIIDQLDQLWLEFIVPNISLSRVQPNQIIEFDSIQTKHTFKAQIQSINSTADEQTGRLQIRAKVLSNATELRPNLMVNVKLQLNQTEPVIRVLKSAIQKIESKDSVFLATPQKANMVFKAQVVELGNISSDGQWIEIKSGLKQGQSYVTQGSFLLKSELEKGEADHDD